MKKYPKLVQCDKRGQIVIPKDIRAELKIGEGTGFWVYSILDEGILLKRTEPEPLEEDDAIKKVEEKVSKIKMNKANLRKTVKRYKKREQGRLEIV